MPKSNRNTSSRSITKFIYINEELVHCSFKFLCYNFNYSGICLMRYNILYIINSQIISF